MRRPLRVVGTNTFKDSSDLQTAAAHALTQAFVREWDNGDVTAPLRSCQRAMVWEAAHNKADKVLHNVGYKGMSHGCNCNSKQCGLRLHPRQASRQAASRVLMAMVVLWQQSTIV